MVDDDKGFHPFGGKISKHLHQLSPSRERLAADDAYLSYYDIRLMKEDVDTLRDDWLTDNCISFWEEWLEHEIIAHQKSVNVVLLRPSMVFMLMQTPDARTLESALPSLTKATHIFLPVNDNNDVEHAEGGSHWSLLLVSIVDGVAFHYDSLNPSNEDKGELATRQMEKLLGKKLRFVDLTDAPQQSNSSDCGVYVCLLMRHLLQKKLLRAHMGSKVNMAVGGREVNASEGRRVMRRIIDDLREEGLRRRSTSSARRSHSRSTSPPRID